VLKIICCSPPSITVSGQATGIRKDSCLECGPDCAEVAFWVFGEDKVAGHKYIFGIVDVDCPGGTFSFNLAKYFNTLMLEPGTYTVIVQHPMYNHKLDIIPDKWLNSWWCPHCGYDCGCGDCDCSICNRYHYSDCCDECCSNGLWTCCGVYTYDSNKEYVISASPVRWSKLFVIDGPDRKAGTAASQALIQGFNDPNIDDKIKVLTFKVESNTAVQADFSGSPTSGPAPLTVQFTDISTGAPTSWSWSFGDGVASSEKNPSHTYLSPGNYSVTLTVSNAYGSSSATKQNYITVTGVGPTPTPTPTPVPGSDRISLKGGWNFISTPRTLADGCNTAGAVFAGVDTAGRSVFLYDAQTGIWEAMTASSPVRPLDGIWIYSVGAKDVPLTFKSGGASTPPTKNVYLGWNAIGFSDVIPRSAQVTLGTVDDHPFKKWVQVIGWNAPAQSYESPIFNYYPHWTEQMQPTKGYWMFMNGDRAYYPWILASLSS